MQISEYLPLGSIVKIKKFAKEIMIIKIQPKEEQDYVGVTFPTGFETSDKLHYFKSDDIEKVLFIGRINKEVSKELKQQEIIKIVEGK